MAVLQALPSTLWSGVDGLAIAAPDTDSLDARHVCHEFESRGAVQRILDDINVSICTGEIFCLIGPSGCGKTTLLDIFAGFVTPTTGEVSIGSTPVVRPGSDRVVVFQDVYNSLFPWMTVRENVEFGLEMAHVSRKDRAHRADECLELVGLTDHWFKFPDELSGGMKQRVQIARALAIEPKVLLMDEPFGALDAFTRRTMQEELLRIWTEIRTTILFVTHDMFEAVLLGDRIGVMSHGPASRINEIVSVALPRPRSIVAPEFIEVVRQVEQAQSGSAGHDKGHS